MNRILFGCVILMLLSVSSVMEEKIIDVPDEMTIEMVVADENGYLDGTYDMRIRLYVPSTYERLWYQDLSNIDIVDGAFVISVNSNALIDAYELYNDDVKFVITIDDDTIEVPLLTYLYSYRSLFAEFGWDTRFPDVLYIDRTTGYFGFGTQAPKMYFDVNGALKLDYEITEVTGSIRWNTDTFEVLHPSGWVTLLYTPDSFIASRWTDYGDSIELTSSNYLIGINKTTPTEVLDIEGDVNFTGGFNVDSIVADSIQINSVELTDAGVTMASVELI